MKSSCFDLWTPVLHQWAGKKMAEVDFGDSELFEQLDDSAPTLSKHIRFTDDEEDQEEMGQLRSRLEECDADIQRLTEENILVGGAQCLLAQWM